MSPARYPNGEARNANAGTVTMTRDQVEARRLTAELASLRSWLGDRPLSAADANALRRILCGLYTLMEVHFAKEEVIYLPVLDVSLTPGEAREIFEAMEAAASTAQRR